MMWFTGSFPQDEGSICSFCLYQILRDLLLPFQSSPYSLLQCACRSEDTHFVLLKSCYNNIKMGGLYTKLRIRSPRWQVCDEVLGEQSPAPPRVATSTNQEVWNGFSAAKSQALSIFHHSPVWEICSRLEFDKEVLYLARIPWSKLISRAGFPVIQILPVTISKQEDQHRNN